MKFKQIDIYRDQFGGPSGQTFLFEDGSLCTNGIFNKTTVLPYTQVSKSERRNKYPTLRLDEFIEHVTDRKFEMLDDDNGRLWQPVDIHELTSMDYNPPFFPIIYKVDHDMVWNCTFISIHPTNSNYLIYLDSKSSNPISIYKPFLGKHPYYTNKLDAYEDIKNDLISQLEYIQSKIKELTS